ncbi:MAG: NADPH:quinone reductase [Candidatus Dormibacteria bacterium]|jgi:NADPH2:quinone reductase
MRLPGCSVRAAIYRQTGGPEVLHLVDRPAPIPRPGEVLVRIAFSGVNPTDWKSRQGSGPAQPLAFPEQVPNQDGSGTIVGVGQGVDTARVGQGVWIWEAAWERSEGTAQEFVTLPEEHAVPLPDSASFSLGASIGIPALTAHRCLTVGEGGPDRLGPGALTGRNVLVAGGAGAVGHAAIELAVWSGATVVATVSSPEKAGLARATGAHHVVNYLAEDAAETIRRLLPEGAHVIVEVAPAANSRLDQSVLAAGGVVAAYANDADTSSIQVRPAMVANARFQFVLVYTEPAVAKRRALEDVQAALAAPALRVGAEFGLPLHHFPLERIAEAHAAVENRAVGKVLVDVARDPERSE